MKLQEFTDTKKAMILKDYDDNAVDGYSYTPFRETNNSLYCEEHYWISRIDNHYHLILCNADFLDADLPKLETMLHKFVFGEFNEN
jgi:hypothetical protein|tara:strand:+ start:64 stop:321 length:258 start_codon:yes stop_codon:yes gene_type:complete